MLPAPGAHYPFTYKDGAGHEHRVYPAVYQGILNFGLSLANYESGYFLTEESVLQRAANRRAGLPEQKDVRDFHANLRTGMKNHVRVITIRPGQPLFRFGASSNAYRQSGPWWTTKLGFEQMLLRKETRVVGGRPLTLREYARRYSAVARSWSEMDRVFLAVVQQPIRCFMGMGSKQYFYNTPTPNAEKKHAQVHVHHGNLAQMQEGLAKVRAGHQHQQKLEEYGDENVQLYLPNLAGYLSPGAKAGQGFLHIEREWSPEEIDQRLSKLARRLVHEARHGGHLDGESRRQRLQEICRALGYDYHHLEERPLLATE